MNHSVYKDGQCTLGSLSTTSYLENNIVWKRINVSAGSRCIVNVPKVLCQQVFLWWGPRFTVDSCMIIHDLVTGVPHMPPGPPPKISPNILYISIWKLDWWINSRRKMLGPWPIQPISNLYINLKPLWITYLYIYIVKVQFKLYFRVLWRSIYAWWFLSELWGSNQRYQIATLPKGMSWQW